MSNMEQTGLLAKICPTFENTIKELVTQVALEEGIAIGEQARATGGQSNHRTYEHIKEINNQMNHVFDEMQKLKNDMHAKVDKTDLEQ